MVLLWFAQKLNEQGKIGPIRAVFIHHHTRRGQDHDQELVEEFCSKLKIPFKVLHAEGLNTDLGNFESRARIIRRDLLTADLKDKETLWLGHHIDDSFEWSFMQRYRSSQPKSSLGIPVRNGKIIRPFMCVTKKQLKTLSQNEHIIYREDPTNADIKYDRNFLREELFPILKKRYPKYLKHYVNNSNYLAALLHLNITNRVTENKISLFEHGAIIQSSHFSQFQIQEVLESFSKTHRGEITTQIQRMIKAIDNGKKGPFHFSGGTEAYYTHNLLMIYRQGMRNNDKMISLVLEKITDEEILSLPTFSIKDLERAWENLNKTSDAMMNMPGLVLVCEPKNIVKTLNGSVYDSLFPSVSAVCKDRGIYFMSTLKCIETWRRKKTKLPDQLRILPLWTLSNLFAFQE